MYPALAVHSALISKKPDVETLWVGGEGGMEEELVNRAGIPFRSIPAAGVHGIGARALPGNVAKLTRGVFASRRILREFKPDMLFFTGGFIAAPMALAGRDIPTVLYVPDIEPGLSLKFISRFADVITVTTLDSRKHFPSLKKVILSGYPLRAELSSWSREKATQHFGLAQSPTGDINKPTLLVTGGSKGAHSINMAVLKHLNEILEVAQIIHVTGNLDWAVVEKAAQELPEQIKTRYHAMPYLHEMGAALAAADLVVSRAGASTLGEYPFFGLPAVLAPYPHAWRYQRINADFLAGKNAAVILQDELLEDKLLPIIQDLLLNKNKLEAMRAAMKKISLPNAANVIASQLVELAGEQPL